MFVSSASTSSTLVWILMLNAPMLAPLLLVCNEKVTHTPENPVYSAVLLIMFIIWCYKNTEFRRHQWRHTKILLLMWSLTDLLCIRFNGLSCTGYSSGRAGACRYTAMVFCIPATNCFAEKMARQRQSNIQYASLTAILWCLFTKGFHLS